MTTSTSNKTLQAGVYGITAEKFSRGRSNVEVAAQMIKGGITTLQYREKKQFKGAGKMLQECQQIREMTLEAEVCFIINDHVDLALLVDADGVHVGQEDLPVEAVRRLIGPDKIIGLSTHSPAQAAEAVTKGADYIGVGPIFTTNTKEEACAAVGFSYLEHVVANCPLPFVALGGVKEQNIDEVIKRGAKTICLVTEIVGSPNISATVSSLHNKIINR